MKTDDYIAALAADAGLRRAPAKPPVAAALWVGILVVGAIFMVLIGGVRPDFGSAVVTVRFAIKIAVTLSLAVAAFVVLRDSAYPEGASRRTWMSLLVPAGIILAGMAFELASIPADQLADRLVGSNSLVCLVDVTLMGVPPLVLMLFALRRGAPARPALAGLSAGLLAGAIASFAYAIRCPDDSPLFVAAWYSLAIGSLALTGALIGSRTLRW